VEEDVGHAQWVFTVPKMLRAYVVRHRELLGALSGRLHARGKRKKAAQWVFTIPKMLRVYFLHHRKLLGALSLAAYQTVKELMASAAVEGKGFRPGVVSVAQTFGEGAKFHPYVHALVSRGGWTSSGD
jgi:hypothetical protein